MNLGARTSCSYFEKGNWLVLFALEIVYFHIKNTTYSSQNSTHQKRPSCSKSATWMGCNIWLHLVWKLTSAPIIRTKLCEISVACQLNSGIVSQLPSLGSFEVSNAAAKGKPTRKGGLQPYSTGSVLVRQTPPRRESAAPSTVLVTGSNRRAWMPPK